MSHANPALRIERDAYAGFARVWALLGLHRVARVASAHSVPDAADVLASVRSMKARAR